MVELPTLVKAEELNNYLNGYENREYIVQGFTVGFDLGHLGETFVQATRNAKIAEENEPIVQQLVDKEVKLGRFQGPFECMPFENTHISPLSMREKSTLGEYRLLHNLLYPYDDRAVNKCKVSQL